MKCIFHSRNVENTIFTGADLHSLGGGRGFHVMYG